MEMGICLVPTSSPTTKPIVGETKMVMDIEVAVNGLSYEDLCETDREELEIDMAERGAAAYHVPEQDEDPQIVDLVGERFDLDITGSHVALNIPRSA